MRALLSIIPVRREASESSEMVSQLLFGELVQVLEETPQWLRIKTKHDDYEGWVDRKMLSESDEEEFPNIVLSLNAILSSVEHRFPLTIGAKIPEIEDEILVIGDEQYAVEQGWIGRPDMDVEGAVELILQLKDAPYLWGGRHPFGIDCSGFSQLFYRLMGHEIPRDASQQVKLGEEVFLQEAQTGDLAFFVKNDKVTHVGVLLDNKTIIHASGKVRIDDIDNSGIFVKEHKAYSHHLLSVKRILA